MWFKNLQVYRLPAPWAMTAQKLEESLQRHAFTPCTSLDLQSQGWIAPRDDGALVHTVDRQMLILLGTEKKLLPASVINQVTKARAVELEEQQGFAPGRKQLRELKEQIADELLPRAFSVNSQTHVWIDPLNGWLVIDSGSTSKADEVFKLLLKSVDTLPVESLRTHRSPQSCMTEWLATDEAPAGFTVDQDTELRSAGESKATVRYIRQSIEPDDVSRHIAAGKQCTRLAMSWSDRVSFVLTESLTIKRVTPLDVLLESPDGDIKDAAERFDSDFLLMAGELHKMLTDLVGALGGEFNNQSDLVQRAAQADEDDTDQLYDQAVAIVMSNQRASISLVQRHLRISYNRAARLLESMEKNGLLGSLQSNGSREILKAA